jgi:hypothetical protein
VSVHVLYVPTEVIREEPWGKRWCFYCRKRVTFTKRIHAPTDPMSYYGPHVSVKCDPAGHHDGDLFPGSWREWGET